MRLDTFFIAFMFGIMFITGGVLVIGEAINVYEIPLDAQVNATFSSINDEIDTIRTNATKMKDDVVGQDVSGDTAENDMFAGAFKTLPNVWRMFKAIPSILTGIAQLIGIPPIMSTMFMIVLLLGVTFSIIYTVWRFQPR